MIFGLALGAFVILGIRFVAYQPPHDTHFHANFAVYINGVHEQFKEPKYYEEVKAVQYARSNDAASARTCITRKTALYMYTITA